MLTAGKEVHIGIVGEFGAARVSPRQLLANCQGAALLCEETIQIMFACRPGHPQHLPVK